MTKPLIRCNGTMTEAQFLSWVRSALRAKSLRWPPRAKALELARRKYIGPNKLQKWEYQCKICEKWFKLKDVAVDHFPKSAGSILSIEDIGKFTDRLYCETDNLRILCHEDHAVWTCAEKNNITFDQARIAKQVIEKCKLKIDVQLALLSGYGYNNCSNAAKRKAAWTEILNKENK